MRLTLIALLLAGVAGCGTQPATDGGRDEEPALSFEETLNAAEQGDAEAKFKLGRIYHRGDDVRKDLVEAAKWYRKAAEQGDASGQVELGRMYYHGEGVPEDDVEACAWYSVAATNGDSYAKKSLPKAKARLTPEQLAAAQKRATELIEQLNANKAK